MVVKQMKKDIERESYEEWVRLCFLDEDAKREWNHGHQNRRIVVKARNVLCSLVERERPITYSIFYHLNMLCTHHWRKARDKSAYWKNKSKKELGDNGILMRG
jgi:hypothetical protein